MKMSKLIILVAGLLLAINSYAQSQFVHLLTKAEAATTVLQIGCKCYKNVEWITANSAMTAEERRQPQPFVKSNRTQTYELYEIVSSSIFGQRKVFREKHIVVVIELVMRIKEPNMTNLMENRNLTFIGEIILKIMTQQEEMNVLNRQCMDAESSQALFDKLITPALKELSPPEEGVWKN